MKKYESIRGMLHEVYCPFVYGSHVTQSWLCLDCISSNIQYSRIARSKELTIRFMVTTAKYFILKLSTRNVTVGK